MTWLWQGKAWVFGDEVPNDDGIMPLAMVRQQEYDPAVLSRHCFEQIDPGFVAGVRPRDFVVGGRNFGHGNPHVQGFLGLKALGVGLLVESMARGPYRACVNAGVPVLLAPGVTSFCAAGDLLEVDFEHGILTNCSRAAQLRTEPLAGVMREIIAAGGGIAHMRAKLSSPVKGTVPGRP